MPHSKRLCFGLVIERIQFLNSSCSFQERPDINCSSTAESIQYNYSTMFTQPNFLNKSSDFSLLETNDNKIGDVVKPAKSPYDIFQLNLSSIPVLSFFVVLLCIAGLINGFVLQAAFKVPSKVLPARYLLMSNLISNLVYAISTKAPDSLLWISVAFGLRDSVAFVCLDLGGPSARFF